MKTEKITNNDANPSTSKSISGNGVGDQSETIKELNETIGYEYDTAVIGNITKDNEYADPDNKEFIWPENYIRVNAVRWLDSVAGPNAPDPMIQVESFNGQQMHLDIIPCRFSKEAYENENLHVSPIISAFLDSPFNDVEMINRETERFLVKMEEERRRYSAFKKNYDPEEQRLFEEWKLNRDNDYEDENTNFGQSNPKSVWELLSEATTEDLFKFKLDIFEQEVVQNSEDRELRSKIRKAKSICEVCAAYQTLLDNETDKSNEE